MHCWYLLCSLCSLYPCVFLLISLLFIIIIIIRKVKHVDNTYNRESHVLLLIIDFVFSMSIVLSVLVLVVCVQSACVMDDLLLWNGWNGGPYWGCGGRDSLIVVLLYTNGYFNHPV